MPSHLGVYGIIVRPGASAEPSALLLSHKGRGPYKGSWDLPGGRIEFGETPEMALAREVAEETGLPVLSACLLGVWSHLQPLPVGPSAADPQAGMLHHLGIIYRVEVPREAPVRATPDGEDSLAAAWFAWPSLVGTALTPFAERAAHLRRPDVPVDEV